MFLLLYLACEPPPEAPTDLSDLTLYLYENFDTDLEALALGAPVMQDFLLAVDPDWDVADRAVTLPTLTFDRLGGAPETVGADPELQVPVAVMWTSRQPLQSHFLQNVDPNQICYDSSSSVYHHRTFITDPDCFADGSCDVLETVAEIRREEVIASFWYDYYTDVRRVQVDDQDVLISRGWMLEPAVSDGGDATFGQSYMLDVRMVHPEDPGKTLRFYGIWSSFDMVGVSDDLFSILIRNGIQDSFELLDDFVDGVLCDNDRDYEPERE
jgi:hypothetical protein